MSNIYNDNLVEEARFHQEYWTGTIWEKLFEGALKNNDLERVHELLQESRREMFAAEYRPEPHEFTDEELEQIGKDFYAGKIPF